MTATTMRDEAMNHERHEEHKVQGLIRGRERIRQNGWPLRESQQ
jgi:hypothetical protein